MRSLASLLALVAATSLAAGCHRRPPPSPTSTWSPEPTLERPTPEPAGPYVAGTLTLTNGVQAGDMGEVRAFDGVVTQYTGSYDPYGTSIRLDSEGEGWWTMSAIYVTGDLASAAFAPGARRTYTSGTYGDANNVSVTGCSGPSYGNYTYDHGADEVSIEIEALADGTRRMHFETIYTTYDGVLQVTTGSVDYVLPGTTGATTDRGI